MATTFGQQFETLGLIFIPTSGRTRCRSRHCCGNYFLGNNLKPLGEFLFQYLVTLVVVLDTGNGHATDEQKKTLNDDVNNDKNNSSASVVRLILINIFKLKGDYNWAPFSDYGFESQAHHLRFFQCIMLIIETAIVTMLC